MGPTSTNPDYLPPGSSSLSSILPSWASFTVEDPDAAEYALRLHLKDAAAEARTFRPMVARARRHASQERLLLEAGCGPMPRSSRTRTLALTLTLALTPIRRRS